MSTASHRAAAAALALAVLIPLAAFAATKPFPGPSGWDHTVGATPTPQSPRAQETWKKSDGELLTYLADAGLSFDDTIAAMKKNITDNGLKPSIDKDRTCDGRRAHEVEMMFASSVVRQIVVDDAPGVTKVTYFRPVNTAATADATSAITSYCGP